MCKGTTFKKYVSEWCDVGRTGTLACLAINIRRHREITLCCNALKADELVEAILWGALSETWSILVSRGIGPQGGARGSSQRIFIRLSLTYVR